MLFIASSCNNKVKIFWPEDQVSTTLMSNGILDNDLLQPLNGQMTVQNSMKTLWLHWDQSMYEQVSSDKKSYEEFFVDQNPGMPSPEQKIVAYEIRGAKTASEVFYALPTDNEWKWLTQSQVGEFIASNRGFIRDHNDNIVFFCKKDENKVLYERNLASEMIAIVIKNIRA